MKKFFVAMGLVAFAFVGCDDSSSASAGQNDEPGVESSSSSATQSNAKQSSSSEKTGVSSGSVEDASSSSVKSESSSSGVNPLSSSSETVENYSSSEKELSSSSVALAEPCKTKTEDNCEYGTLLDERDGQEYKTVKIGNQWWMAENLNYYDSTDLNVKYKSWCYNDSTFYCEKYGRLYSWEAAINSVKLATDADNPQDCGYKKTCALPDIVQGICPEGWHLPDTTEWLTLFDAVGGRSIAAYRLKSASGWFDSGDGSDDYALSALPAGFRYSWGSFINESRLARFWCAAESSIYDAYSAHFICTFGIASLRTDGYKMGEGYSVRCLKD